MKRAAGSGRDSQDYEPLPGMLTFLSTSAQYLGLLDGQGDSQRGRGTKAPPARPGRGMSRFSSVLTEEYRV